jgi:N-acetylglutamate synthase-like GNAT family acetyltransferase
MESYEQSINDKEFYVAAEDEQIVGFGVLNRESQVIEAIFVRAEAKGLGVGLKLLQKLEERGRDLGLKALHLNASLNAVSFYKRAGFVAQEGAKYRLPTGIEIRCVPMVKELMPWADAI